MFNKIFRKKIYILSCLYITLYFYTSPIFLCDYKVKKGDSLYSISRKFNISIHQLVSLNKIVNNKIYTNSCIHIKKLKKNLLKKSNIINQSPQKKLKKLVTKSKLNKASTYKSKKNLKKVISIVDGSISYIGKLKYFKNVIIVTNRNNRNIIYYSKHPFLYTTKSKESIKQNSIITYIHPSHSYFIEIWSKNIMLSKKLVK